jgi:hypothetical protein
VTALDLRATHLRALRHERPDPRDTEHHRVADDLVHAVALERRLRERERKRQLRRGGHRRQHPQDDPALVGELDAGEPLDAAPVEHPDLGAGRETQDPHEVRRLVVVERDGLDGRLEIGGVEALHRGGL